MDNGAEAASPAINRGSNPVGFLFDERGADFFRVVNGQADVGAFEVQKRKDHHRDDDDELVTKCKSTFILNKNNNWPFQKEASKAMALAPP